MTQLNEIPILGMHTGKQIAGPAYRRVHRARVRVVKVCHDNRAYFPAQFTIPGPLVVGKQTPEWRADRDYWLAKISAEVGRHDSGTHPTGDGTPSGAAIKINVHRVKKDLSVDTKILASDSRLRIDIDHHQDVMNDGEDGETQSGDFNVHRLAQGDRIYIDVLQVGSGRPGTALVVTVTLVPMPS